MAEAAIAIWLSRDAENPLHKRFARMTKAGWTVPENDEAAVE